MRLLEGIWELKSQWRMAQPKSKRRREPGSRSPRSGDALLLEALVYSKADGWEAVDNSTFENIEELRKEKLEYKENGIGKPLVCSQYTGFGSWREQWVWR